MSAERRASSPVVKLKPQTHSKLQAIAREDNRPMGEIVTELVDRYERERYWRRVQQAYAQLKADPVAWKDYVAEVGVWDTLAGDGLQDEDPYYTPEEERAILAEVAANRTKRG